MSIEIIKDNKGPFINPNLIRQIQVTIDGKHFLVSSRRDVSEWWQIVRMRGPHRHAGHRAWSETMAFRCKPDGRVASWKMVASSWQSGAVIPADANLKEVIEIVKELFGCP